MSEGKLIAVAKFYRDNCFNFTDGTSGAYQTTAAGPLTFTSFTSCEVRMGSGGSTSSRRRAWGVGAPIAIALLVVAIWRPQWSDAITMQVVDADGAPLAGVIVVALWRVKGGLEGGVTQGVLKVSEAVTDSDGWFRLAAWGPRFPNWKQTGKLKNYEPGIYFFKPGYQVVATSNGNRALAGFFRRGFSENGKRITLERFEGTAEELNYHMRMTLGIGIGVLIDDEAPCEWKNVPRTIEALRQLDQAWALPRDSIYVNSSFVSRLQSGEKQFRERGCGSVAEFMRSLGNG